MFLRVLYIITLLSSRRSSLNSTHYMTTNGIELLITLLNRNEEKIHFPYPFTLRPHRSQNRRQRFHFAFFFYCKRYTCVLGDKQNIVYSIHYEQIHLVRNQKKLFRHTFIINKPTIERLSGKLMFNKLSDGYFIEKKKINKNITAVLND